MVVSETGVKAVDLRRSTYCTITPSIDATYGGITTGGSGGVTNGGVPIICADGMNQCYKREGGNWTVVYTYDATLMNANTFASTAVDDWIFYAGGNGFVLAFDANLNVIGFTVIETPNTLFLKADGTVLKGTSASPPGPPDLGTGKSASCAAVVVKDGNRRVIAVLGGLITVSDVPVAQSDMELFDCDMSGTNPTCTKLANGPSLNVARGTFGCGVISADDGKKIFLAMKESDHSASTEVLDITSTTVTDWSSTGWQILSPDVSEEVNANHQTFVETEDDAVGIWFMGDKDYFYQVTCASATSCTFTNTSLSPAYTFPAGATPMLVSEDDFSCP